MRTFLDSDLYEAGLGRAGIEAVITSQAGFKARLTWVELHDLQLLRCEENVPRIGYMTMPLPFACVSLPENSGLLPRWRGIALQAGDVMFHSLGERLHQATKGPSVWSLIAIDPIRLDDYSRTLFEKPLAPPAEGVVLRLSHRDAARLQRLHMRACRLAETKSKILAHPEVASEIEQEMMYALATCLTGARVSTAGAVKRRRASAMIRFEGVLADDLSRPLHIAGLSERIGISDQTLRSCCTEFLGISPTCYVRLRRLKQARTALREADPATVSVAEIARACGFTRLGRFAGLYQTAFGETPWATLRRLPSRPGLVGSIFR
jgi:AraC-like DNA-binding protein